MSTLVKEPVGCALKSGVIRVAELVKPDCRSKLSQVGQCLQIIVLYYFEPHCNPYVVNYRIYNCLEGKSKDEHLQEMLEDLLRWGIKISMLTGESCYSSIANLKFLRFQGINFLFAVDEDRLILGQAARDIAISPAQRTESLYEGQLIYLKSFGFVRLIRTTLKNRKSRQYILYSQEEQMHRKFPDTMLS